MTTITMSEFDAVDGHPPKILCPVCHRLETMPTGPGLPECFCDADGAGPCKTAACLVCADKAIQQGATASLRSVTDRRGGERRSQ